MGETKTTTEEVVETEEATEEDVSGVEGYDYEEDLEYDEEGNVIIPEDGEENPEEEKEPEEEPKEDPRDRRIKELTEKYAKLESQSKATLKDLGYEGEDVLDTLAKVSAESRGQDHDAYKKERAEEEHRAELERKIIIAEGEKMMAEDLAEIKAQIPGAAKYKSPTEFPAFRRFGELRDLGLSPVEAFRASHPNDVAAAVAATAKATADSKGHMTSVVPKGAKDTTVSIPKDELEMYRDMYPEMSDKELTALYKRATKK